MGTIDKYLLPVRTKIEYKPREDGSLERMCYVACSNGEILTGGLPFGWAQYICRRLNGGYYEHSYNKSYNKPIAVLQIDGNPLQKSEAKMATRKNGKLILQDSPAYIDSIKSAKLLGEQLFIERWTKLPIEKHVCVACEYYLRGRQRYNLSLCNAWVLDLLYRLHIIKTADHHVVKSMDGSGFYKAKDDPYTLIKIMEME